MLKALYRWTMEKAASKHAGKWLAAVSFAESSFFPIPPDVMLAPMVLARPDRAFVYAGICTAASVVGGLLGYAIGFYLEPVGMWLPVAVLVPAGLDRADPHAVLALPQAAVALGPTSSCHFCPDPL